MDMRDHRLSYSETVRKYWEGSAGKEKNYINRFFAIKIVSDNEC